MGTPISPLEVLTVCWWFPATGNGSFGAVDSYATALYNIVVSVGDFNGDGKPDLMAGSPNGIFQLLNWGTGTFGGPVGIVSNACGCGMVAADFNGDGLIDLASAASDTSIVTLRLGLGNGNWNPPGVPQSRTS